MTSQFNEKELLDRIDRLRVMMDDTSLRSSKMYIEIGKTIRKLRCDLGLSTYKFACMCERSISCVSRWETGFNIPGSRSRRYIIDCMKNRVLELTKSIDTNKVSSASQTVTTDEPMQITASSLVLNSVQKAHQLLVDGMVGGYGVGQIIVQRAIELLHQANIVEETETPQTSSPRTHMPVTNKSYVPSSKNTTLVHDRYRNQYVAVLPRQNMTDDDFCPTDRFEAYAVVPRGEEITTAKCTVQLDPESYQPKMSEIIVIDVEDMAYFSGERWMHEELVFSTIAYEWLKISSLNQFCDQLRRANPAVLVNPFPKFETDAERDSALIGAWNRLSDYREKRTMLAMRKLAVTKDRSGCMYDADLAVCEE